MSRKNKRSLIKSQYELELRREKERKEKLDIKRQKKKISREKKTTIIKKMPKMLRRKLNAQKRNKINNTGTGDEDTEMC